MESGVETPRDSNSNSFNGFSFPQFRPENPSEKLKAYNFVQSTSLVDQVLRNPSDNKGKNWPIKELILERNRRCYSCI